MGSGTVLRENTHKRRENPYFVDFLGFFGPERPREARSIPGGTWGGYFLLIAVTGPICDRYDQKRAGIAARKISKRAAVGALESFMDYVTRALKKPEGKVTLVGFGTFSISKLKAPKGRNPQTGASVVQLVGGNQNRANQFNTRYKFTI
jgi:nucleoid DNA-binding protein